MTQLILPIIELLTIGIIVLYFYAAYRFSEVTSTCLDEDIENYNEKTSSYINGIS